jgi:hypothetical protein
MPPQPLSSVRSDARLYVGAGSAIHRPLLAQLVAHAVANWADIGYQLGGMLATMLGADAAPSIAMFYALSSSAAQIAALGAAAESILGRGSRDLEVFELVMLQAKKAATHRHRFAHWPWAHCDDLPDALLFIDPEALVAHDIADVRSQAPHDGRGLLGPLDRSRVYVYRERDLKEATEDLWEASYCISHLRMVLSRHLRSRSETAEWRDHIYQHLLSRPGIAEALTRLRERQKTNPGARPSRRQRRRTTE